MNYIFRRSHFCSSYTLIQSYYTQEVIFNSSVYVILTEFDANCVECETLLFWCVPY